MAQLGSAVALGATGRRFKSFHSDHAEVVELVYTTDLKSVEHRSYGFDSRLRHHTIGFNMKELEENLGQLIFWSVAFGIMLGIIYLWA